MSVSHINPPELFQLPGFSQIVVASPGKLAFIAGQGAFDRDFKLIGEGDLHAQTVQAFSNLKAALAAVHATPADVVSSNMYVVNLDDARTETFVKAMNAALDGQGFPPNASTLVGVTRLGDPRMLVEISAIAAVP
ncbi:MAG TPA: RidA family protein [Nevskiaceae bacterium]|nr:RidA family protein [Nevskiaceae bacterium]